MPDIHFDCPKCKQTLDASEELAAQLIECPTCKETIEVPVRSSRPTPQKPPEPAPKFASVPTPPTPVSSGKKKSAAEATGYVAGQAFASTQAALGGSSGVLTFFSIVFILASIGLVIVGLFLVGSGFSGEADEARRSEGSAIRQTVYAVQYGSGFIVIALGFVLSALTGILNKRSG